MAEIWNLSTLCRCCHSDGCFKSLNLRYCTENGIEIYETMLLETLAIKISQPPSQLEASYTICDNCITQLRAAMLFRKQVLACERKFQIYCTNEQFMNGATDDVKMEEESIASENDYQDLDEHSPHHDDIPDEPNPVVKQEITIDIGNQIKKQEDEDGSAATCMKIETKVELVEDRTKLVEDKTKLVEDKTGLVEEKETLNNKKDSTTTMNKAEKSAILYKKRRKKYESYVIQTKSKNKITYSCKTCGGCYQNKQKILKHISVQHFGQNRNFKEFNSNKNACGYCGKEFKSKTNLKAHEDLHTKQEFYQCDICQKKLKYKNTLRKHILEIHSDQKELLCDICGWAFKQRSNLESHIRTVHLKERPYSCEICPKTYTAKKHLKYHMKTAHLGNPKPFPCDLCSKGFASIKTMKVHRLTHENKFICRYCSLVFDNREDRFEHSRSHSIDRCISKQYDCHICGKILRSKFTLNRHVEIHSGVKKFSCSICGAKFTQKCLVYRHKKNAHDPNIKLEKTKCNLCKRPFRNMEKHMKNTHSADAKKYFCDICGKCYSENNALNRHKNQIHYGVSQDCELCGKKYLNKRSLQKHKLKIHKIKKEVNDTSNFNDVDVPISVI